MVIFRQEKLNCQYWLTQNKNDIDLVRSLYDLLSLIRINK